MGPFAAQKGEKMKKSALNLRIREMVFCAILTALIIVMTFVPQIGYITINFVPTTLIHIPVIVGGIILGRKYGLFLGLVFGIGSMIRSFMEYSQHAPFTNPLLSVVPRAFIGFITADVHQAFTKLLKRDKLAVPFTLGVVTLIHSLIVLPILYWFGKAGFFFFNDEFIFNVETGLFPYIWSVFVGNSLLEIAFAILIGSPIALALKVIQEQQK